MNNNYRYDNAIYEINKFEVFFVIYFEWIQATDLQYANNSID